jgi:hypothetical protein
LCILVSCLGIAASYLRRSTGRNRRR